MWLFGVIRKDKIVLLSEFISKLKLAHDVPNFYCNKPGKNLGYHWEDGRFSFDCWNLIKAILAGWDATNPVGTNVPPTVTGDISGYQMLMQCTNRSKDFTQLKQPGTYLYLSTSPHAGVYIGDFTQDGYTFNVVECTGAWESKVQYTYVDEKGGRYLYKGGPQNKYSWTDYGLLPWVEYTTNPVPNPTPVSDVAYGIDVSRWQRGFDLMDAKVQGFTYSILKAGGADSGYYKDPCFEDFYKQAKEDKMYIGAYYYGNAFSVDDAVKEANYLIQYLQGKDIVHVYYDVEGKMLNQGYQHLTSIIQTFCQTMITAGYACGIYTSESHFNSRFDDNVLIMYPHWVAKYSKNPPKLKSIALTEIWQYGGNTNFIRSPQINGTTVDQNQINIQWVDDGSQPKETVQIVTPTETKKSVDQLANEVLAGLWGNGIIRQMRLLKEGYDYKVVQSRVNEIASQRKETKKTYVVVKNDTLSSIAKRYNTTVDALVKANGIPNKNKIYVGQELIIA
jgi:GH25 family lysozyme M1 (1,4-beta-N-acetylmuramidase)